MTLDLRMQALWKRSEQQPPDRFSQKAQELLAVL